MKAFLHASQRLVGVLVVVLGVSSALPVSADAQDRGVPRFGPLVEPDTVEAGPFDHGRLWSFARPPLEYFEEQYDVQADPRGLRHARLGTVRLPDCSGAVVSPDGLVVTAARCVHSVLSVAEAGQNEEAFYAETQSQERRLSDFYAEQVVSIDDVTEDVDSLGGREQVEARRQEEAEENHRVEVVPEAGGTEFVAYTYRRYEDVRLAFVPDEDVRAFGRMGTVLSYPQHTWDVAVLRLYEGDTPVETPQHLELRVQGARPGSPVFAVAHPPDTRRVETHEQLAFQRDVRLPLRQSALDEWISALQQYVDTSAAGGGEWAARLTTARADRRQSNARLESLRNDYFMARLRSRDQKLRRTLASGTASPEEGTVLDQLEAIQDEKRDHAERYRAFGLLQDPRYRSATTSRALIAYQAAQEGTVASEVEEALWAVPDQPAALDAAALDAHVRRLRRYLEPDSSRMRTIEDLGAPQSVVRESVFSSPDSARARLQAASLPEDDPAIQFVAAFYDSYVDFKETWADLADRERQLTDSLAQIRHRAAERPVSLPRARSLRIADGRIQGYPFNGTVAPAFTTFYGLYGRHYSDRGETDRELPDRWANPPEAFDRSTPLTTVSSTDLGSGAYGGPLLNTSLQLVGLVFDGNVQSAGGEYLYLPRKMRTVAVDVRGMLEGLTSIYGAERLVNEMKRDPASQ